MKHLLNNFYYILLYKNVYIWGGKNQLLVFSVYYGLFEWLLLHETYFAKKCTNSIEKCITRILWCLDYMDSYFRRVYFNFDGNV